MSKKDKVNEDVFDVAVEVGTDAVTTEDKEAAFKAKKAEAAKRFKERRAAEKVAAVENSAKLIEVLKSNGAYDNLPEDLKSFLNGMANPVRATSGRSEVFTKLFGATPEVGATVTLKEAFERTYKSLADLKTNIKKWAATGTVVEVKEAANMLDTTFTIVSMA